MKFGKTQNFLIIVLVFIAIYQTGMLWLGENTSHNFFYTIFSAISGSQSTTDEDKTVIDPERVIVGYGNKVYNVVYPKSILNNIYRYANNAIGEVVSGGNYVDTFDFDWEEILASKLVIYEYPFTFSLVEYANGYTQWSKDIASRVYSFDNIIIVPNRSDNEDLYVYFINSEAGTALEYSVTGSMNGKRLYEEIEKGEQDSDLMYLSSKQLGFNIFKDNIFVPRWTQESYVYNKINISYPFERDGAVDVSLLETGIERFFTNYASKQNSFENNTYLFSDESTVVKYYENGILEYYNYDTYDEKAEQSIASAYYACKQFLNKDITLNSNIHLAGVEISGEGLVFYFDYNINNVPICFSAELMEQLGIKHSIEIVVKNNTIRKYKRFICDFTAMYETKQISNDFLNAIDYAISMNITENAVNQVDNVYLSYYFDIDESVKLKWIVDLENKIFVSD